jgi:hypothetical protein
VVVRLLALILAVAAGLVVSVFSVDLGPSLRARAEREGSRFIERPMRIGRLSAKLTPGVFVVEDLVIEGLRPGDRPFLTAKRITVSVPWWTALSRRLVVDSIHMTDWRMVIETFPNGRHNFPRFTRPRDPKAPRRNFTTTVRSVTASNGHFTYADHGTPWSTVAPNMNVSLWRSFVTGDYRGRASFSSGTIKIQTYEPFGADMRSRFKIDGGKVVLDRIDLISDGARSVMDGVVDLGRWPEQIYNIKSDIDFATQKGIFFHRDPFTVSGRGEFTGTFHLFSGGRELKGNFTSPVAGVTIAGNDWRFANLRGAVRWVRDRLDITDTTTDLMGGRATFDYRMAPFGKGVPTIATWDVRYEALDLARLTDFLETQGLRLAGRASGRNTFEWPLGRWGDKRGGGDVTVRAPEGVQTMTRELPADRVADETAMPPLHGPFNRRAPLGYVPVAGYLTYRLDPQWITIGDSWMATPKTYVAFSGRTAYGERSRIPFHVTSLDWQESDRVLAGIMTTFGSPTGAIPIGGYGEFDGVMLNAFTRPRIEGTFTGHRMRAWDVIWGDSRADFVVENSYATVTQAVMTSGESEIVATGTFSLGYPRRDKGEEINAVVRLKRRPLADLRHAFELDDYPVEGFVSGEYHLYGNYETPFGFGRLIIEEGVAYGEPFERAIAALRFEGTGVRLDGIQVHKSTGTATGAAWVGWEGDYSFNMEGTRIPVESVAALSFPRAPLSGLIRFTATGAGTFEEPRYGVKLRIDDLYAGDEGIGLVTGNLFIRSDELTTDFEAQSPRLNVSGSGRIALTETMDSDIRLRFGSTSLDPYIRFFEPRMSPFTTAIVGGTVRVEGQLADPDALTIRAAVEELDMKLFDYRLTNDPSRGPISFSFDRNVVAIESFHLAGEGTQLQLKGEARLTDRTLGLEAQGDANLGILQGFFRELRSRGTATLTASVRGNFDKPAFAGSATITDGRIRHTLMPHSLEAINGAVLFDAGGVRIDEGNPLTARVAGGDVSFGGRISIAGFTPGDLNLTATGQDMRVRYPAGFVSRIDADLWLRGTAASPILGGTVTVDDAVWTRRFELDPNIFTFGGGPSLPSAAPATTTIPLRFDILVNAPRSLRVQNNVAEMVASAELRLQGTYDRPLLFGHAEVDRGSILFEGNRYLVTRGSIDFLNPAGRIEPLFDIEAETRVRVPSQTYRVTLGIAGTPDQASISLGSDPPLSQPDIISLLLGGTTNLEDAELRALNPDAASEAQEALLRNALSRLLAAPLSAPVRRVVEETFGVTAQIQPTIGTEADPLFSSARVILGRRLSPRAFLTYSRALGTATRDQIIILEYDQSDRLGFVLTRNHEGTFAIDFRVRHSF